MLLFHGMAKHVSGQVNLECTAVAAETTCEELLISMRFLVSSKCALEDCTVVTHTALIRLLPCLCKHMLSKIAFLLWTIVAQLHSKGSCMLFQSICFRSTLIALITSIGLFFFCLRIWNGVEFPRVVMFILSRIKCLEDLEFLIFFYCFSHRNNNSWSNALKAVM